MISRPELDLLGATDGSNVLIWGFMVAGRRYARRAQCAGSRTKSGLIPIVGLLQRYTGGWSAVRGVEMPTLV